MVGSGEWYQEKYEALKAEINEIRIKKMKVGSLEWVELFDELASSVTPPSQRQTLNQPVTEYPHCDGLGHLFDKELPK